MDFALNLVPLECLASCQAPFWIHGPHTAWLDPIFKVDHTHTALPVVERTRNGFPIPSPRGFSLNVAGSPISVMRTNRLTTRPPGTQQYRAAVEPFWCALQPSLLYFFSAALTGFPLSLMRASRSRSHVGTQRISLYAQVSQLALFTCG